MELRVGNLPPAVTAGGFFMRYASSLRTVVRLQPSRVAMAC